MANHHYRFGQAYFDQITKLAVAATKAHQSGDTATRDDLNRRVASATAALSKRDERGLKDYVQRLTILKIVEPGVLYLVARERYHLTRLILQATRHGGLQFDPYRFVPSVVALISQAEARFQSAVAQSNFGEAEFYARLAKHLKRAAQSSWLAPKQASSDKAKADTAACQDNQWQNQPFAPEPTPKPDETQ